MTTSLRSSSSNPLLPRAVKSKRSPPTLIVNVTEAPAVLRASFTAELRSQAALSAETPITQSPLCVSSRSFVNSIVLGCNALTRGCPWNTISSRMLLILSRLKRWLAAAALSAPLCPKSDEGAAEDAEAEPLGWGEGPLALLEKRTEQHQQPAADD